MIFRLSEIGPGDRPRVGGKAFALARASSRGIPVPPAICLGTRAYQDYVSRAGLRQRILLELNRKDFGEMRWEEIWDASHRIRNLFLTTPLPPDLAEAVRRALDAHLPEGPFVVRSSAPDEDSASASFAGIHDSYVNVRGADSVLDHVKKVWASLWSEAALRYRRELGLDPETSAMAVLIQRIVVGDCSGLAFSRSPSNPDQAVIEAVYGLNQGLVDGAIEPDRWFLDRETGRILGHDAPSREARLVPLETGVGKAPLPPSLSEKPPLEPGAVRGVFDLVMDLEGSSGTPQDMEWTLRDGAVQLLQARPITAGGAAGEAGADRAQALSLRKSYASLKVLGERIEFNLIPAMIEEAGRLADTEPGRLSDADLASEIERRDAIHRKWLDIYQAEFIPFAHGVRLFGRFYNDRVRPRDPYAFMELLVDTELESVRRNGMLEEMARLARRDAGLALEDLTESRGASSRTFDTLLDEYLERYGGLTPAGSQRGVARREVLLLVREMAARPPADKGGRRQAGAAEHREAFLARFEGEEREQAAGLLDLARASHRLRDNDNIYLGNIERQLRVALDTGRHRLARRGRPDVVRLPAREVSAALRDPAYIPARPGADPGPGTEPETEYSLAARQLIGQPAGPGICTGRARVILEPEDLLRFRSGEVLVCDAVDPNMTFLIPLAAGVVERRGGMLIHGAIIAREYGLPCVTGVPLAARRIRTGDRITVDGYLGIVILG